MQIGVTFPQSEISSDPGAIRTYAQAVEGMGYRHLLAYDHVLGADPAHRPGWKGYTHKTMFHEPFVLFGYLAALTRLELVTGVIILPQRQTALVAKQAAQVDILTDGRFRLGIGVGWNAVEYEALGVDFRQRGRIMDEQVDLLRRLWNEDVVTYKGKYHTVTEAGINPLPVRHAIPIWTGGASEAALRRTARIADGWFPLGRPGSEMSATLERLYSYLEEAGRDRSSLGIEARVSAGDGDLDALVHETEQWEALGATHITLNTMNANFKSLDEHLDILRRYKEAVTH
jgi:probable F420-dependent oxidoreductase